MEMQLYASWLGAKARERELALVEKPRTNFVGYRWEFMSDGPLRWVGTIELDARVITELAVLPLDRRRAHIHGLFEQMLKHPQANEKGCGGDPQPFCWTEGR
jgi:hypothetical protein